MARLIDTKADRITTDEQLSLFSRFVQEMGEQMQLDEEAIHRIKGALPLKADRKDLKALMAQVRLTSFTFSSLRTIPSSSSS